MLDHGKQEPDRKYYVVFKIKAITVKQNHIFKTKEKIHIQKIIECQHIVFYFYLQV